MWPGNDVREAATLAEALVLTGDALNVLVVEDNPADAERVRAALEERGGGSFQATYVRRLRDALPHLRDSDLVLLDLSLPDARGTTSIERIRLSAPGIPVVVLSGNRDEELTRGCLRYGAQDVLLKGSIEGEALVRAMLCALDRQARTAERDVALLRADSESRNLRGILATAREGVVVTAADRRVLYANTAGEALLGWLPGDAEGRLLDLEMEGSGPFETERRGPDGETRTLEVRSEPITWEGAAATLVTLHDLTATRRAEDIRRATESDRMESERLGALGRLAGGIAHALNNHLTVVLGHASRIAERDESPPSVRGHAHAIERAGWHAAELVHQLTACAGAQMALPEVIDLNLVVAGLTERVESAVLPGGSVRWELHHGRLPVRADRRLVEQALLILVGHAKDALPAGAIVVRTARVPPPTGERPRGGRPPGSRIAFAVTDRGPPLTPEARRRLFEPFYSTEVLGIGSGLGLAPVLGIARQCDGEVLVESTLVAGTTIRVLLPEVDDGAPAGGEPPVVEAVADPPKVPPRGDETVLVVEGDASCRAMITGTLRELGYLVLSATDAAEAIRLSAAWDGPLPLLIAAHHTPGLRGPMLTRVLNCRFPALRAIVLTSADDSGDLGQAAAAGIHFLITPFDRRELAREVRRVLDLPRSPVPPAPPATGPRAPLAPPSGAPS